MSSMLRRGVIVVGAGTAVGKHVGGNCLKVFEGY